MISPLDAALDLAPKSFNRVSMNIASDILSFRVSNGIVLIANLFHGFIDTGLIRKQGGTDLDIFSDQGNDIGKPHFSNRFGNKPPLTLNNTNNGSLVFKSPIDLPFCDTSHIGFVSFNNVGKFLAGFCEQKANLLCHTPGGFVGYAKRPFKLHRRHSVPGIGKQEDRVGLVFKRGVRLVEDRASQLMKLVPAILARLTLPIADLIESRIFFLAGWRGAFGD